MLTLGKSQDISHHTAQARSRTCNCRTTTPTTESKLLFMSGAFDAFYWLVPGVDVVPVDANQLLFQSDTQAIRIEGPIAGLLADQILPLLDGQHSWTSVSAVLTDVPPA